MRMDQGISRTGGSALVGLTHTPLQPSIYNYAAPFLCLYMLYACQGCFAGRFIEEETGILG